jgi:hypothetical protein
MSSANRDILTVSLPICIPFIPSSCLIALARNSSTMLNRSGDKLSVSKPEDIVEKKNQISDDGHWLP